MKTSKAVHRPLTLTSPIVKGADVTALQTAIKAGFAHYKIDWLPVTIDGELGPQTIHAARFYTWVIGLGKGHREPIQKRRTIAEATQKLIRDLGKRSKADRRRAKRRQPHLARIREAQDTGTKALVSYAHDFEGVTEDPPGSNSGPLVHRNGKVGGITFWEKYFGLPACYWCGCWAGYVAKAIGKAKGLTGVLTYGPDIIADAQLHRNGLVAVPAAQSRAGDLPVYWGGEHIGLCVGLPRGGCLNTIEGNTSSDDAGDQSNGGGVFPKHRPFSDVTVVARPLYKP